MSEKTLGQKIFDRLKHEIAYGKLKPGQHLSGSFLKEKYDINKAMIREVLGQLDSLGFVSIQPNRGAFVTDLTLNDYDVISTILIRCESYATWMFVNNRDHKIVKELQKTYKKMGQRNVKSNIPLALELNDKFHKSIYLNCGSQILSNFITNFRLRLHRFRVYPTPSRSRDTFICQHGEILEAICKKNDKLAERLMKKHLEFAQKERYKIFKKYKELM